MNIQYKEFIGFYRNIFPKNYCERLIEEFKIACQHGAGNNRQIYDGVPRHKKDDYAISVNCNTKNFLQCKFEENDERTLSKIFFDGLQICFDDYSEKFSILKQSPINCNNIKMQRTDPGGGYHVWHSEQGRDVEMVSRVLVYMLYLNTLKPEECGETEFLYQQMRIRPEENLLLIWPAAYTHAHRGNVVHGTSNKYVVTGWFHYE